MEESAESGSPQPVADVEYVVVNNESITGVAEAVASPPGLSLTTTQHMGVLALSSLARAVTFCIRE